MAEVYDALVGIAPVRDPELLDGVQRYESLLTNVLTPEQLARYAESIQNDGKIQIVEDLTTDEMAALAPEDAQIALAIMADEVATMENRRVVALIHQREPSADVPTTDAPTSVAP